MKHNWRLAFFACLISTAGYMDAAFSVKNGKFVNTAEIATLSAEEHFNLGAKAMDNCDWKEAAAQFRIVSRSFPNSKLGQESLYYLGVAEYFLYELDTANESFSQYLKAQNNPQFFAETMQFKYAIATELKNGAKIRFFGTRQLPKWASGTDLAVEIYDEIIAAIPCSDLAAQSLYAQGQILWKQRLYRDSIDVYLQLIRRFPKHEYAPESYLIITQIYLDQARCEFQNPDLLALAQITLRRFKEEFPRDERVCQAEATVMEIKEVYATGLYETGQFYERKKEPRASIIYYSNAINQFPDTAVSKLCQQRLAALSTFSLDKPKPQEKTSTAPNSLHNAPESTFQEYRTK